MKATSVLWLLEGELIPGCQIEHPGDCQGVDLTFLLSFVFFPILYLSEARWKMWNTEGESDPY